MIWSGKSLLLAGKSRTDIPHPCLESIGKEKFFLEFKNDHIVGQSILTPYFFAYQNKEANNQHSIIIRTCTGDPLHNIPLNTPLSKIHTSTNPSQSLAYNDMGKIILINVSTHESQSS